MTLPIDLDCFTPDNRRAVVLRVQKSASARRGLFPVRCMTHGLRTFPDWTERLSALFECIPPKLRGGLRLPVFLIQSRTAFPLTRRAVRAGRGDALPASGMRSLGSFQFINQRLHICWQAFKDAPQSKTSIREPIGEADANRKENLNGKIIFQEVRNVF